VLDKLKIYWDKCENEFLIDSRRSYIAKNYPEIIGTERDKLAVNSRGLTKQMLDSSLEQYKKDKKIAPLNSDLVPVDVMIDNYMLENYVSPAFFEKLFSSNGFKVRSYPCMYNSRRLIMFAFLLHICPGLLLKIPFFSKTVLIKATKQ
jgi:hypothetical protein